MKYILTNSNTRKLTAAVWLSYAVFSAICSTAQNALPTNTIYRTFRWSYGGYDFKTQFSFNLSDYQFYRSKPKFGASPSYVSENFSHRYLLSVAATLDKDAQELGYSGWQLANYLVAFVQQSIPYTIDPSNNGFDFPRYPIETLVEVAGDCEDKAALLAALLKIFGYDVIQLQLPGHIAVGIACDECCGTYYTYNAKKYYFLESTGKRAIGNMPDEYEGAHAKFWDVPELERYRRIEPTMAKREQNPLTELKSLTWKPVQGIITNRDRMQFTEEKQPVRSSIQKQTNTISAPSIMSLRERMPFIEEKNQIWNPEPQPVIPQPAYQITIRIEIQWIWDYYRGIWVSKEVIIVLQN